MRYFILIQLLAGSLLFINSQIDFGDNIELESIRCFVNELKKNKEYKTELYFKFSDATGKYYHAKRGDKLYIKFYDVRMSRRMSRDIIQSPFSDIQMKTKKENVQLIEELHPRLRSVVVIELSIEEGLNFDYTMSGELSLIKLTTTWVKHGKLKTQQTQEKSRIWSYVMAGAIVAVLIPVVISIVGRAEDEEVENPYKRSK